MNGYQLRPCKGAYFIIKDEGESGYPGWINLIGIESPGLTASLAIGEYVGQMVSSGHLS